MHFEGAVLVELATVEQFRSQYRQRHRGRGYLRLQLCRLDKTVRLIRNEQALCCAVVRKMGGLLLLYWFREEAIRLLFTFKKKTRPQRDES